MSRYEEPSYTVLAESNGYEIRHYDSYLAAETEVRGSFDSVGTTAFRRLAGFIFGGNSENLKMNMTVPVTREPTDSGSHRYRFVMEQAYSEEDLPRPVDDKVTIVRVPGGAYAARRYRGSRRESSYRRAEADLRTALQRDGIEIIGTPVSAVYDGPLTPPMLRRNEVLIPVAWHEGDRG